MPPDFIPGAGLRRPAGCRDSCFAIRVDTVRPLLMDTYDNALMIAATLLKACMDVGYAVLVGSLLGFSALQAAERAHRLAHAALHALAVRAALLLLIGEVSYLWLQAAAMTGLSLARAPSQFATLLTDTHFGMTWATGLGATVVLCCALLAGQQRARGRGGAAGGTTAPQAGAAAAGLQAGSLAWIMASLALAVLGWAKAATSHAADGGDASLGEWVHWVHMCATAAWSGMVMVSAWCVLPAFAREAGLQLRQAYLRGLSNSAAAAMVLVLASGAFNAWHGLGGIAATPAGAAAELAHSPWGRLLLLKLLLTALLIACGALNRLIYLPRLNRDDPALTLPWDREDRYAALFTTVSRLIAVEAVLMAAVLACAAWLSQSAPAG